MFSEAIKDNFIVNWVEQEFNAVKVDGSLENRPNNKFFKCGERDHQMKKCPMEPMINTRKKTIFLYKSKTVKLRTWNGNLDTMAKFVMKALSELSDSKRPKSNESR